MPLFNVLLCEEAIWEVESFIVKTKENGDFTTKARSKRRNHSFKSLVMLDLKLMRAE